MWTPASCGHLPGRPRSCQSTARVMRLVTLTTDFGTQDGYVGAMKGVLLERAPRSAIVDVTHESPREDVAAAAFAIAQAARCFPAGTIHVVVVDPGVGGARR